MLAELASPQQAMRWLARRERRPERSSPVSVAKIDRQESSLAEITSIVSFRTLSLSLHVPTTHRQ